MPEQDVSADTRLSIERVRVALHQFPQQTTVTLDKEDVLALLVSEAVEQLVADILREQISEQAEFIDALTTPDDARNTP